MRGSLRWEKVKWGIYVPLDLEVLGEMRSSVIFCDENDDDLKSLLKKQENENCNILKN